MTMRGHCFGIIDKEGRPGLRGPMSSVTSLIFLRSWSNPQESDVFLWVMNTDEFQGLSVGVMWPCCNCSFTSLIRIFNFFSVKGHWSIYIGRSVFQVNFKMAGFNVVSITVPHPVLLPIGKEHLSLQTARGFWKTKRCTIAVFPSGRVMLIMDLHFANTQ